MRGRPAGLKTLTIVKRLLDGYRLSEVAREFGLSRQRIEQIRDTARMAGFDIRSKWDREKGGAVKGGTTREPSR